MKIRDPSCPKCSIKIESVLHALRDYVAAKTIWLSFVREACLNLFFEVGLQDQIQLSLHKILGQGKIDDWKVLWAITCHSLWF